MRIGLIAGVLLSGLIVSQAIWGWWIFDLFRDPSAIFGLPFVVWLAAPFIAVAAALADGHASRVSIAVGFGVAVAGTVLVPVGVDRAIENDPSSTAGLAHLWDPLPVILAVGVVFGVDFTVRRLANRSSRSS